MASKGACHKAMIFICGRLGFSPALLHLVLHRRCQVVGNFSALGFKNLALDNDCTFRFVETDLPQSGNILSRCDRRKGEVLTDGRAKNNPGKGDFLGAPIVGAFTSYPARLPSGKVSSNDCCITLRKGID